MKLRGSWRGGLATTPASAKARVSLASASLSSSAMENPGSPSSGWQATSSAAASRAPSSAPLAKQPSSTPQSDSPPSLPRSSMTTPQAASASRSRRKARRKLSGERSG